MMLFPHNRMLAFLALLADAQEELASLGALLTQATERLGAQRVRQFIFAILLFWSHWRGKKETHQQVVQPRPRRLTRAQAFRLFRCRRRTLVRHRRTVAAAIGALRPIVLRCLLPLPRAPIPVV